MCGIFGLIANPASGLTQSKSNEIIEKLFILSESRKKIMEKFSIPQHYLESIILIEDDKIIFKSTAALKLFRNLNGLWKLSYIFIFVPTFIRNFVYDFIAQNRIKWFGKAETCWVMTPELKDRFI